MSVKARAITTYLFLICFCFAQAQNRKIDSLEKVLPALMQDTNRVNTMVELGTVIARYNVDRAKALGKEALELSLKLKFRQGEADAHHLLGFAHFVGADFPLSLEHYNHSLKINTETGNLRRKTKNLNNIGLVYIRLSDYQTALDYGLSSLKLREETKDSLVLGSSMTTVGVIYGYLNDTVKAMYYFKSAYKQSLRYNNREEEAKGLENMAGVYLLQKNFEETLKTLFVSLELFKELKDKRSIANTISNIGAVYRDMGKTKLAMEFLQEALKMKEEVKDRVGIANTLMSIGAVYAAEGDYQNAEVFFIKSLGQARQMNNRVTIKENYLCLAELASRRKDLGMAYNYFLNYSNLEDSLLNDESNKSMNRMQILYDTEKKNRDILELTRGQEVQDSQLAQQNTTIIAIVAGLALILLLAFFIYRGYRQKQTAEILLEEKNRLIEEQGQLVQEKNKNITDSINYAQRIQSSILPPDRLVNELLPDSFVLYLPKDIVSGDFYWMEKSKDKVVFAAVDCTGHGVPGAMMSVLGFNLLSQAVNERGLTKPSDILRHLDAGVNTMLRQSTETNTVKDGMDLALCTLDIEKKELQYAGAYNGLWVVKGANGQEANRQLVEIKADKSPIGVNVDGVVDNYTNHTLQLEKGDCIYIFSDGYADQFGGPRGKKFKYKAMKELLLSINGQTMKEQKRTMEKALMDWKGGLEQVDDVLVIGVRI